MLLGRLRLDGAAGARQGTTAGHDSKGEVQACGSGLLVTAGAAQAG